MEEELLRFLSHELRSKEKARELIDDAFDRFGISSLELTTQDQRKALAVYLKSLLPYHSIAKGNILLSKLLNILGYNVNEEKYKFTISKEHKDVLEKQLMIDDFLKEVDRSLIKFELIFNIFWRRAGEAELRGISHDEVIKMTRKALNGVKDELKKAYDELAMKAQFEKDLKTKPPEFLSFGDDLKIPHFAAKEKSELQKGIEDFWRVLSENVRKFEEMFFETLDEDIKLRKQGLDDYLFIEKVRGELSVIWHEIESRYLSLKKKVSEMNRRIINKS